MPLTLPTASDAVSEAEKIATRIAENFRQPNLDSDRRHTEDQVLSSLAVLYFDRNHGTGSKKWDHTIAAALVDSQDAAPYMDFAETVMSDLKNALFAGCKTSEVWRRSPSQWALSWNDEED